MASSKGPPIPHSWHRNNSGMQHQIPNSQGSWPTARKPWTGRPSPTIIVSQPPPSPTRGHRLSIPNSQAATANSISTGSTVSTPQTAGGVTRPPAAPVATSRDPRSNSVAMSSGSTCLKTWSSTWVSTATPCKTSEVRICSRSNSCWRDRGCSQRRLCLSHNPLCLLNQLLSQCPISLST